MASTEAPLSERSFTLDAQPAMTVEEKHRINYLKSNLQLTHFMDLGA